MFTHLPCTLFFYTVLLVSVAWFTFDPCVSPTELSFSEDHGTVTCEGYEHRVALATVGFSRGVHYWEFIVNRFDSDTDPSFGVARLDVSKNEMLGEWFRKLLLENCLESA